MRGAAGTVALLGSLALFAPGCGGGTGGAAATAGASGGAAGAGGTGGASGGAAGAPSDGGACATSDFSPCGGDLVGTWHTDPRCGAVKTSQAGYVCPGEVFDLGGVTQQITWTFNADHTFVVTLTASGSATVMAQAMCLMDANHTQQLSCDAAGAGAMYAGRISIPGGKAGAPSCVATVGPCFCSIPFSPVPVSLAGTYTTSGATVTANVGTGGVPADYCVSGNTLKLRNHGTDVAPATGDFVRQ
jgi:hypothetical protein